MPRDRLRWLLNNSLFPPCLPKCLSIGKWGCNLSILRSLMCSTTDERKSQDNCQVKMSIMLPSSGTLQSMLMFSTIITVTFFWSPNPKLISTILLILQIENLKENMVYQFQVAAANLAGVGAPSKPSKSFKCEEWTIAVPGRIPSGTQPRGALGLIIWCRHFAGESVGHWNSWPGLNCQQFYFIPLQW